MQTEQTLFQRLGGTAGISTIVDDIVDAHAENPAIRARFLPVLANPEKMKVIKQHIIDFFSMGSGGGATYRGRSMRDAHTGMNISGEEFLETVDDIMKALRKNRIDEQTQKDVLAIAYSLKGEIVRV